MEQKTLADLTPDEFIPEICRRTGTWASALAAMCKIAELQGHNDDPRLHNSLLLAEFLRAAGLFIAQNKDALLAVIKETATPYEPLTRAISDALAANSAGPWEGGTDFNAAAVLAEIERQLRARKKAADGKEAEKDEPVLAAILTDRPATQNSDRLDYLDVVPTTSSVYAQGLLESVMRAERGVESLKRLEGRRSTRSAEWKVVPQGGAVLISRSNDKGEKIEVAFKSLDNFKRDRGGGAPKMARLILTKAGRNIKDGKLASEWIALNAAELVGLRMYQYKKDAREGIRAAVDAFSDFKLVAKYKDGKNWRGRWVALITAADADFDGDDLFVKLNPDLNWGSLCSQYTYLPTFYFALKKPRSVALCEKVFSRARMRGRELIDEKADAFYVNLDPTVMEWLDLPRPESTHKAKEKIKIPLIEAVAEINEKAGTEILRLETQRGEPLNPDLPVRQWLTGRLRVDIRGTPAWKPLLAVLKENKKVQKDVAKEERRAERKERRKKKTDKKGADRIDDGPAETEKIKF